MIHVDFCKIFKISRELLKITYKNTDMAPARLIYKLYIQDENIIFYFVK